MTNTPENIKDNAQQNAENTKDKVQQGAENVKEGAKNVGDNIQEGAKNVEDNIQKGADKAQGNIQQGIDKVKEKTPDVQAGIKEAKDKMPNAADAIEKAKNKLPNVVPPPPDLHAQAPAAELKSRLSWGEPGLTIIDARDSEAFRRCRIQGAVNYATDDWVKTAQSSLEPTRDIYVYGASDQDTAQAANSLREAGFQRVAAIQGGLDSWIEIRGAVEGIDTNTSKPPTADNANVASRLQDFADQRDKEKQQMGEK